MNMKLILATVFCTALIATSSGQAVNLLNVTLRQCNQMLNQFQQRFPIMNSQIDNLKQGLLIIFNHEMDDKDLEGQYALIHKINQDFNSLPKDAVQRISTLDALRLVPHLRNLNNILPSNQAVFRARIIEYGSVGNILQRASVPLIQILNALAAA